ncbi:MAG: phosphate ABC transporter permease subunit PstC, partial [Thermoplasmata archaeon]|nr:phosphate ABC transporter permease subunit PstC [Thermoplasmata archaeon]
LATSLFALALAVPIALGVAIFLSQIAPAWLRRPLTYVVDLSAAIPSVVYGFWAFFVLVPIMSSTVEPGLSSLTGGRFPFPPSSSLGYDIFTATIVLTIMILPTIAAVSRESMLAVPRIYRDSALSLGATRWEATRMAVLGPARTGVVAGIMLGLGRALGETIAVTMVIGNVYILPGTIFSPGSTLSTVIVTNFTEVSPGTLVYQSLLELAVILLAITVLVNVIARGLLWRFNPQSEGSTPFRPWRRRGPHRSVPPSGASKSGALPDPTGWRQRISQGVRARIVRRRAFQSTMAGLTILCLVLALAPLASVVLTAVRLGGPAVVRPSFYTSVPPLGCNPNPFTTCALGGIGPEIQGTLIMLSLGALIAVPLGILAGIYLAEYGRNRFGRIVSFFADVMTGIPTIILAVFVFALFIYLDHDAALSALSGGVGLGVLMTPIVTRATEESLRSVPDGVREAALALGFPRHRVTLRVVLGSARSALVTGILLATSRAMGDTAILLLLAGGSGFWFTNLTTQTAAISPFIFANFGSSYANLRTDAWGASLVLLAIMLAISLAARLAVRPNSSLAEAA